MRRRSRHWLPPGRPTRQAQSSPAIPLAMVTGDLTSKRAALSGLASLGNNARHAGSNSPPRQYPHSMLPHARGPCSAHSFGGHSQHRSGLAASGYADHEAVFDAAVACRSACYSFGWSLHFSSSPRGHPARGVKAVASPSELEINGRQPSLNAEPAPAHDAHST
jgi:hypothetical protein